MNVTKGYAYDDEWATTNMRGSGNPDCFKSMQIQDLQIELTKGRHVSYLTSNSHMMFMESTEVKGKSKHKSSLV